MSLDAALRDDLLRLSREIHADPELGYQERRAVDRIVALLAKHGHTAERGTGGLETAFRARVGPAGPSIALLAEYDALAEVGHACGHNLIAMTNVGAFLLAARRAKDLSVGLELIGTPAEEGGGGKIKLIEAGVFGESVAVMSTHPTSERWSVGNRNLGHASFLVSYHGVAAHAAASPEKGRNALAAIVQLFVAIDAWRQHLPSDARVHGIITNGGAASNVIPAFAQAKIGLRAAELTTLDEMGTRFREIVDGCALQTGTRAEVVQDEATYEPNDPEPALVALLAAKLAAAKVAPRQGELTYASTDLGNVSHVTAAAAISFPVAEARIPGHSIEMREASITDLAHRNAEITIEALAAAALDLATQPQLRRSLRPRRA